MIGIHSIQPGVSREWSLVSRTSTYEPSCENGVPYMGREKPVPHVSQLAQAPGLIISLYVPYGQAAQRPGLAPPQKTRCSPTGHAAHGSHAESHVPLAFFHLPVAQAAHEPAKLGEGPSR